MHVYLGIIKVPISIIIYSILYAYTNLSFCNI